MPKKNKFVSPILSCKICSWYKRKKGCFGFCRRLNEDLTMNYAPICKAYDYAQYVVVVESLDEWHEKEIGANKEWKVPDGMVYEVYFCCPTADIALTLNGVYVAQTMGTMSNLWLPCTSWFKDDLTGGIYSMSSKGLTLTSGDVLKCDSAWRVRYRRIR